MAAASTARLSVNSASVSAVKRSSDESFLEGLKKSFVLMSAGMQYQAGYISEEMAYLSRSAFHN